MTAPHLPRKIFNKENGEVLKLKLDKAKYSSGGFGAWYQGKDKYIHSACKFCAHYSINYVHSNCDICGPYQSFKLSKSSVDLSNKYKI